MPSRSRTSDEPTPSPRRPDSSRQSDASTRSLRGRRSRAIRTSGRRSGGAASGTGRSRRAVSAGAAAPASARSREEGADSPLPAFSLHLLDMGERTFGDCIVVKAGRRRIMIDAGLPGMDRSGPRGPSLPEQLQAVLGRPGAGGAHHLDLLVITHCHLDHIGCLPALVREGLLKPELVLAADEDLGYGLLPGPGPAPDDPTAATHADVSPAQAALRAIWQGDAPLLQADAVGRERIQTLLEALRADVDLRALSDARLDTLLDALGGLRERYTAALSALARGGAKVLRYRGPAQAGIVERALADVGLRVLGPSAAHLEVCRARIQRASSDALHAMSDDAHVHELLGTPRTDTRNDPADERAVRTRALRWLLEAMDRRRATDADVADPLADAGRPGAAVNNQSIMLSLEHRGKRVLLTGDMQLAKSQVSGLDGPMGTLRRAIVQGGPYVLVKMPHHSSDNAVDAALLQELGARVWLHSGGSDDATHPDPDVLALLEARADTLTWARTDRNGMIGVNVSALSPDAPMARVRAALTLARGTLDDARRNRARPEDGPMRVTVSEGESAGLIASGTSVRRVGESIEVTTRLPVQKARVRITIEVDPDDDAAPGQPQGADRRRGSPGPALPEAPTALAQRVLGGGRALPRLLFVTNTKGLEAKVGADGVAVVQRMIQSAGQTLLDVGQARTALEASRPVRQALRDARAEGVVIVGGPDVVPSSRLDVLPPEMRAKLGVVARHELDQFIVWSDEIYADEDGDQDGELPVSRVPDAGSVDVLTRILSAPIANDKHRRAGIRNRNRPFAKDIYDLIPGTQRLLSSAPDVATGFDAARQYIMLHGAWEDATKFTGESPEGGYPVAMDLETAFDESPGAVCLAGCCWGALIADVPAVRARGPVVGRSHEDSLAIRFLAKGGRAFIGCTGAHYSPPTPPYENYGGPMHRSFWDYFTQGEPPARALFLAKADYIEDYPHGLSTTQEMAVELKILRQFTCLGLGW